MFETKPASAAAELALDCLRAGVDAADPAEAVDGAISIEGSSLRIHDATYDLDAYDELLVVGGGKAADELAAALEPLLGDRLTGGVVVTNERTAAPDRVTVLEGEHPTPAEGSVSGATTVLEAAAAAGERTLVLAVITGGGSALLAAPQEGLDIDDLRAVTDALLASGASIDEINAVRRPLSRIKGGGLAAAGAPATVVGLLISDVVGDDPSVIASGPTVPTETDPDAALELLDRYEIDVPSVREWLAAAEATEAAENRVENHVIVSGRDAIDAASDVALERGYTPSVLSTRIEGESSEAGRFHAAIAAEASESGDPTEPPVVFLSGGETTVTVTGDGIGGPNQEFALGAARALPDGAVVAAIDTDGSDGSTDAAGAIVDSSTLPDVAAIDEALAGNDAYHLLDRHDALLRCGPTGTNVNDLRVVVVP